jgi:hypothetical protein
MDGWTNSCSEFRGKEWNLQALCAALPKAVTQAAGRSAAATPKALRATALFGVPPRRGQQRAVAVGEPGGSVGRGAP